MLLTLIVLLPFLGSACAAFLPSNARNAEAWLSGAVALACVVLIAIQYPLIVEGEVVRAALPWMPQIGLELNLRMDGYAWLFALLVSFMGTLVVLYARYYMSPADPVPRFFSFLMAFMGAMLGVVLSGNLIQLVMFWELTSLTSFMLIGYWYHRSDARHGARMALTVTVGGGFCLLIGVLILGHIAGSYDLDQVLAAADAIRTHPWYSAMMLLIVLGTLTKSAQFPFHFWLPHAMAAPTPVSAYLHSATMVKAGVFLMARLWPVLSGTDLWFWTVGGAGLCTLLLGGFAAIFQRDMKGVLAYSTISHLGLITLLLGMNSRMALVAAVFHMVNHATFKASLFMATGIVDHETGTRDLQRLGGLSRIMPITTIVATVAAAAMAGVPLLNGFLSKEMFFAETMFAGHGPALRIGLPAAATIAGMFSVAYSLRFIDQVFFGPPARDLPRTPHEPIRGMLLPSALLVIACLLVGILPASTVGPFLETSMHSILGANLPEYSLAVWHGFTMPLVMSVLAMTGGLTIYLLLPAKRRSATGPAPVISHVDARRAFDVFIVSIIRASAWLTRLITSRRLQTQLTWVVCAAFAVAAVPLSKEILLRNDLQLLPADPVFALLWLAGGACAIGAALQAKYHRLAALIMVGATGLATCLTFAWFSAPDLALTQIAVEVVTLVLILLGLRWLPRRLLLDEPRDTLRAKLRRSRDAVIAVAAGAGLGLVSFAMLTRPPVGGLSSFFLENALPQGGGHNVVNVILVDFRGFDTLGEITVVGVVALTVYALLRRFRPAPESIAVPHAQLNQSEMTIDPDAELPSGHMKVPAVILRLLLPMAVMVSLYFLLRGHDAPGGGFVGGLVMATAILMQYIVGGAIWVESRLKIHPRYWLTLGLLAATSAGLGAWLATRPFLTALTSDLHLPFVGDLHLSTVLLFDLGVYLLVVGGTTLILIALAHQSFRTTRKVRLRVEAAEVRTQQPVGAVS
ncbi:monovalent cation/H+ antiporter subunit A [Steroidobacter denitrificans]|uniref:Monovalent cation/H+ antiporter subunit A n=1 Tax=Steroidobacter denitrificans TaxID=465721 RepID=A0A127F8S1_STEDE|nr:monovalent cation/H+ antiporter subunit A [Steroidobacter denitrificans]AMN45939.1 monovalent cation/H+ antiporter subunit A [Steroidobacter denitrificans]